MPTINLRRSLYGVFLILTPYRQLENVETNKELRAWRRYMKRQRKRVRDPFFLPFDVPDRFQS